MLHAVDGLPSFAKEVSSECSSPSPSGSKSVADWIAIGVPPALSGGASFDGPSSPLRAAIAIAVAAAARGVTAGDGRLPLACFGEVGLTGELRPVAHADRRSAEAAKFGLGDPVSPEAAPTLRQALKLALGDGRPAVQAA